MTITFRDALGYIAVEVDEYGIQFADGEAYFSDTTDKEYRINLADIVAINHGGIAL